MNTGARAANSRPIPARFLDLLDFLPGWQGSGALVSPSYPHSEAVRHSRSTLESACRPHGAMIICGHDGFACRPARRTPQVNGHTSPPIWNSALWDTQAVSGQVGIASDGSVPETQMRARSLCSAHIGWRAR